MPSGVAVVASGFWPAKIGRDALEIVWDDGPNATLSTEGMREQYASLSKTPGTVARKDGDPQQALQKVAKVLSTQYEVPYLAHATMEPLNCVVDLRADSCEIWTGTQFETADRNAAAQAAGLKPEQVKIHRTLLGRWLRPSSESPVGFRRPGCACRQGCEVPSEGDLDP